MVKGILFDVDGTLILSNDAHARSFKKVLEKHGYDVSLDTLRSMMGMGSDQLLPRLFPKLTDNKEKVDEISKERKKLFLEKYATDLKAAPGARTLVQKIKDMHIKYVVASSSSERELDVLLKIANVSDLLKVVTSGSDVEESKPEPDIVKAALQKIGLPSHDVIMLGDTPYDIEAAGKCNVPVIAFRSGGFSDKELKGAIALYDDPSDLLAHFDNSPICN